MQELEGVERVDSLATVPALLSADSGELLIEPLIDVAGERRVADYASWLDRHSIAPGWLFTPDHRGFGLHVFVDQSDEPSYGELQAAVLDLAGPSVVVSGVPIFRAAADATMRRDLVRYVPVTLCVVVLLAIAVLGSWRAVLCLVLPSCLSAWLALSVMGALDVPLSITTVVLPPVILALGCAYSMHLICAIRSRDVESKIEEMSQIAGPLMLSGVTTVIGFLGIALVQIDAINRLGVFGALAVGILLVSTLALTPALIVALGVGPQSDRRAQFFRSKVSSLWELILRRRRYVVIAWACGAMIAATGLLMLRVSTNVIDWFPSH
ncbi:MAG: MMPL family transporter, partial [Myxococcales bacterium]|nr:MMPL family transporter [Myxococcales bacterium]